MRYLENAVLAGAATGLRSTRAVAPLIDGGRRYFTTSPCSAWDNQFYPELGSWLLGINCDPDGGMEIDQNFSVDVDDRPRGPARGHALQLQGGDCTTELFQSA